MLRFKPSVRVGYYSSTLGAVLELASIWSLTTRIDVEINSIADEAPDRSPRSLHPFDLAVDLDTDGDRQWDLGNLAEYLRRRLAPGYELVLKHDHIHVEYDMHRAPLPAPGSRP